MNLQDAEKLALAVNLVSRAKSRITELNELDANESRNIPGFFGAEIDGYYSADIARKIREVMRTEWASRLAKGLADLSALGVSEPVGT